MTTQRTSSTVEVLFELDRTSGQHLHHQLEQQVREAVRSGRFEAGMAMPSTRALAQELGVTRGVVVEAYEQLVAECYLNATPGGATRVTDYIAEPRRSAAPEGPAAYRYDFRPGRPDLTEFPRGEWLKSARRAVAEAPAERLGYLDGHGVPELRDAMSAYLDRARGTSTDPADIVITSGFIQSLQLVARVLLRDGRARVAVEDPWHEDYRRALRAAGLDVVPVPVDDEGILVDRLADLEPDLVVTTPAHQYPTGAVLSAARRVRLLEWAVAADALVIEDDYDAEFRYDREPIGALQGLDPDRVIYAGTASKTLAPGLRIGWLAVPQQLSRSVARAKLAADYGSGAFDQLTMADLVGRGELDRHLRRMRRVYRSRRDALLEGLARLLPELEPKGASAGLHVLAHLPRGVDEQALVRAAAEVDVGLAGASATYAESARPGLVFGYATIREHEVELALDRVADYLH